MVKAVSANVSDENEGFNRSGRRRRAILEAATDVFLRSGYLGTNMDEIADLSGVSKQTIYKHFVNKETLFIEIVTSMTQEGGEAVLSEIPEFKEKGNVSEYLQNYAYKQLTVVLTPRLMQLRRLVIGEVSRFPELAKVLYEGGPMRALAALATVFERLTEDGILDVDDSLKAASQFNWLVMSAPLHQAMLLGDSAIPSVAELQQYAVDGVHIFLAAYGKK